MAEAPSRNFHVKQEQVLVDVFCKLKPIGGDFDGKMGPRVALIWQPIYDLFIKELAPVQLELPTGKKGYKTEFDIGMIQRKWVALKKKFNEVKVKHGVRSYIAKGETGLANEDVVSDKQKLEDAQAEWKYFRQIYEAFASKARFDDSLMVESITPIKRPDLPRPPMSPKDTDSDLALEKVARLLDGHFDDVEDVDAKLPKELGVVDIEDDTQLDTNAGKPVNKRITNRSVQMATIIAKTRAETCKEVNASKIEGYMEVSKVDNEAALLRVKAYQDRKAEMAAQRREHDSYEAKRARIAKGRDMYMEVYNMTPNSATEKSKRMEALLD